MSVSESVVEEAVIEYLKELGYDYLPGPEIAPGSPGAERATFADVILVGRLRAALARINPHLPANVLDDVANRILRPQSPVTEENNFAFQSLLTRGVGVEVRGDDGTTRGDLAALIDFEDPDNNDWLVVNQFTLKVGDATRRPDVVVFVNGMPLAVVELKNPTYENATITSAWNQLQTYKAEVPDLFNTNEVLVVADGAQARIGSLTAGMEWFGPWRTVDGEKLASAATPEIETLLLGVFQKERFLDYIRHFVMWETDDGFIKKIAGYHQYHAVNKAVAETVRASQQQGDQRIGVVWHTQGSGKSISMAFYAAKLALQPQMNNPTIVVITDRNDLDGQLFSQFAAAKGLMEAPVQAQDRGHLRELLQVASGGIVFSTIQKFGTAKGERFPVLSERRNIVVIADEAHRGQYAFVDGFARNLRDGLPNASFIGFTGTPIEFDDRSTPAVFGDYIDTYPVAQAVEDGATVPIYYEARLARIQLPDDVKPVIDEDFEEVTEGEEEAVKGRLKSKWAKLEAMVGSEDRVRLVAKDILEHYDRRCEILEGKAMIVAMSRRIAVDLYEEIVRLRPEWASADDAEGGVKVIMTGSASDPPAFQQHIRAKSRLKEIEKRFKDPKDPLRIVIVRDMWLTGFDAPCAHTLYVDKPMKGHGLMQAIARVNRVFKDKPSGLVVDYLGLADQLRKAVHRYGGKGDKPTLPMDVALAVLQEKFGIVRDMFHGYDYSGYFSDKASARLAALTGGANYVCGRDVAPLSDVERTRLGTIFGSWGHPTVKHHADRNANIGDGSSAEVHRTLDLMTNFMVAELGSGNKLLYENTVHALHRLLRQPAPDNVERDSATKELVLQLEPFCFKLLALLDPGRWEKMRGKGLGAVFSELRKMGANPYTLSLSESDFIGRVGASGWSSYEHAVRDAMELRLDAAHRAKGMEPYHWRSVLCVFLGLVDHNRDALAELDEVQLGTADGKKRFMDAMAALNKAAGIAIHLEQARGMVAEVAYFQDVQKNLAKYTTGGSGKTKEELDSAVRQIVSGAVSSDEVIDIFGATGLQKPDISILSDDFLEKVRVDKNQNLQLEVLKKLLNDEIKTQSRQNVVQAQRFSEMLGKTLLRYQNRTIETAEVISELIELAKEMREAQKRGDELGLTVYELAFFDALGAYDTVTAVMSDEVIADIARELVEMIRRSVTIDWTEREAVKADMRRKLKKLLRRKGYPPDKQEDAVVLVLQQAERVCRDWGEAA